ncbi:MAG: VCBS repeat-containing protein [Acidobacteria bacterium]|nr:VCBS repeat-containing protein [Acidobacteriota bacterium]
MKLIIHLVAAVTAFAQVPVFVPPTAFLSNGTSVTGASTYWSVAADFNRDGRVDLAAPDNRVSNNILGYTIALSTPVGGYSAPLSTSAGFYVNNLCAADFNNDGKPDLLLTGGSATALVLGNGDGTFSGLRFVSVVVTPSAGGNCAAADINKDGNQDILIPGSSGLSVSLGNGDGTFRAPVLYATPFASVYVLTGDFNNDGALDAMAVINSVTPANVLLGNGNGTFRTAFQTIPVPYGALAGDFNGDGKLDLLMQTAQPRQDGSNFGITIALGTGDGHFLQYSSYIFSQPFSAPVLADFNEDGNLDVATYTSTTGRLQVFGGRGDGSLGAVLYESPLSSGPFAFLAADVDRNGSSDLVVSTYSQYMVFRNPRGNPPLLARLTLSPSSVVGGAANSTGTVTLGGPAPAGGVVVTITSSDPAAYFPAGPAVLIPAGAPSATFAITTGTVAAPVAATISATVSDVTQTARLDVVPVFLLTGLGVSPSSQYGIFTSTGTLTLSGPAASSTLVALGSSNPAVASVPRSVLVPAGAVSVSFVITLSPVAANTLVGLTATLDGVTKTASVTVLSPTDAVAITRSLYTAKSFQLNVEATSTNPNSVLTVHNATTGVLIGTLSNAGNGRYKGSFVVNLPGAAPSILVKSAFGGNAQTIVPVK